MTSELLPIAYGHHEIAELDPAARRLALRELAINLCDTENVAGLVGRAADAIDGYGLLSDLMRDGSHTDVLINGPSQVWVERDGRLELTAVRFRDAEELLTFVQRILGNAGVGVDVTHPIADARLADGGRIHVVLPPAAPTGPLVSIRRFPKKPWTIDELVDRAMLTRDQADHIGGLVAERRTTAISGGTGSGKTTLLNALLGTISPEERVILIEETPELRPTGGHVVSLLTKEPGLEGSGGVSADELLRAALRMRPDRIVVGEVRGREALVALQAMSTGHPGSMVTLHSASPNGALERMTSLALQASSGASEASLRDSVHACLQVVVHLSREGGRRRVVAIEER